MRFLQNRSADFEHSSSSSHSITHCWGSWSPRGRIFFRWCTSVCVVLGLHIQFDFKSLQRWSRRIYQNIPFLTRWTRFICWNLLHLYSKAFVSFVDFDKFCFSSISIAWSISIYNYGSRLHTAANLSFYSNIHRITSLTYCITGCASFLCKSFVAWQRSFTGFVVHTSFFLIQFRINWHCLIQFILVNILLYMEIG